MASAQLVEAIIIAPKRGIYPAAAPSGIDLPQPIVAQCTVEEQHVDEIEIISHPIEQGASITDHVYKKPAEITLHIAWSNSPSSAPAGQTTGSDQAGTSAGQVVAQYDALLALQENAILSSIYTGKRTYVNMALASIRVSTTQKTENALFVTAVFRQLLLAQTQTVTVGADASKQIFAAITAATVDSGAQNLGPQTTLNEAPATQ